MFSGCACGVALADVAVSSDVRAAAATTGYGSYLRVINTGTIATGVNAARIDAAGGLTGAARTLNPF